MASNLASLTYLSALYSAAGAEAAFLAASKVTVAALKSASSMVFSKSIIAYRAAGYSKAAVVVNSYALDRKSVV